MLLIDEEGHLLGLVTDGDVRRDLILAAILLEWPVEGYDDLYAS